MKVWLANVVQGIDPLTGRPTGIQVTDLRSSDCRQTSMGIRKQEVVGIVQGQRLKSIVIDSMAWVEQQYLIQRKKNGEWQLYSIDTDTPVYGDGRQVVQNRVELQARTITNANVLIAVVQAIGGVQ